MVPNVRVRDEAVKTAQKRASPATPMVTADKNSGHLINLNEFKELVREHLCGQYSDARLRSWFLRLDTNGSGTVRPVQTLAACSFTPDHTLVVAPLPSRSHQHVFPALPLQLTTVQFFTFCVRELLRSTSLSPSKVNSLFRLFRHSDTRSGMFDLDVFTQLADQLGFRTVRHLNA